MKGEFAQVLEVILGTPGKKWTPDRIKEARPAITLSCETIGHNLRRARRAGRVDVSYYVSGRGQRVAEYFIPTSPVTAGETQFYFFTTPACKQPSPYFQSLAWAKAKAELVGAKNAHFWTGTHEAPIPVEEQGAA